MMKFEDFQQDMEKAVKLYETTKNARLSLLQLMDDVARYVVGMRMVCPATMFRQAVICKKISLFHKATIEIIRE